MGLVAQKDMPEDDEGAEATQPDANEGAEGETPQQSDMGNAAARVLMAATMALKTPQLSQAVMQAAQSEQPEQALADVAATLIDALDEKAGGHIPQEAMPQIAKELVELLAALAGTVSGRADEAMPARVMQGLLAKTAQRAQQATQQAPQGQADGQPMPTGVMQ